MNTAVASITNKVGHIQSLVEDVLKDIGEYNIASFTEAHEKGKTSCLKITLNGIRMMVYTDSVSLNVKFVD